VRAEFDDVRPKSLSSLKRKAQKSGWSAEDALTQCPDLVGGPSVAEGGRGSALSSGRPYGETEWNLKSDEIGDLHLVLPDTARGEAKVIIQLVAPDGTILADTLMDLKMTADHNTELKEAQVWDERAQALGATGVEESFANLDAAAATSEDLVPLPSRRPAQTANDEVGTNWIKPLAFVNLREGPSPSTRVISVVAKGAKLRVIGRKSRWVQVTHPATSERGWIYTGNVASMR
jgi:uncharacterized protein YgiM (DUF1202 family)